MADVQASKGASAPKNGGGAAALQAARAAEAAADKRAEASRAATKANSEILNSQIETAQQAVSSSLETGVRSLEGLTQNWLRAFGATASNPDLAEQSAKNVQAMSQASSALAKGAHDASRVWFDLTQKAVQTNLEAFGQLGACSSLQELAAVHSKLMRDSLQQVIESGEVIARISTDAIREAAQAMRSQAQPAI
ncbi:phasin family protein [Phenylobacterium sp. LjRoot225]|uniref:phasin family protein n=1 Tax=Phenylobacterium sp. LjRoot225 TaxID=3342285 RepID=UPI003ED03422